MELRGSARDPIPGARALGQPRGEGRLEVTVLLRRREDGPALPFAGDPGARPPYSTRDEFALRHGAHPNDLGKLRRFALAHSLEVRRESVGPRLVRLGGTVADFEGAFGIEFRRFAHPGGTYRGHAGPVRLPDDLDRVVVAVLGLDDRPQASPHLRRRTHPAATDVSYSPLQVGAAYEFPPESTGAGQTIAFLELGGGFSEPGLAEYFGTLGIPPPSVTAVGVDGAGNAPTGDANGPDGEVQLDLEVAGALAPGAALVAYFAPNTDAGFLDGVAAALHDAEHRPSVLSISWGGPESGWSGQARTALNAALEDASALGVTVVVASGDNGAADAGTGPLEVDFPASSPWVTGCGGTRLSLAAGNTWSSEVVWNDLAEGDGATGGGVSSAFARPEYQADVPVPGAPTGTGGRGVPDVAGNADPASGYQVSVDGTPAVIGGTSAVAPLWAALLARVNASLPRPVGFLNPRLYAFGPTTGFRDITAGDNGGYPAGPGWDPCTGWGSPRGAQLLAALSGPTRSP